MRIEFYGVDDPGWQEALSRLPHDFYHRPEYLRLEARRMNATAEAVTVRDGEHLFFVPYLIRPCDPPFPEATTGTSDIVSPYGYPGMLLNDARKDPAFARNAVASLCDRLATRGVCSAFFRMHPLLCDGYQEAFPPGTFTDHGETVAIDLSPDEKTLWKQIREGHRATINKCQKLGYTARFVRLTDVLADFRDVYAQTMHRVQAKDTYYFGREYFEELARIDGVHCCAIENGSTIVAACLFFESGGIVQAHLGGTRTEFLPNSPFHMTLHHASLWAKQRGNRWLHLGGGVGSTEDKLLQFKRGFSPVRLRFLTAEFVTDSAAYAQLVDLRARDLGVAPESLLSSAFFPAYRALP